MSLEQQPPGPPMTLSNIRKLGVVDHSARQASPRRRFHLLADNLDNDK
jgi:hypothetical protein